MIELADDATLTTLLIEPLDLDAVEDNGEFGWTIQLHTPDGHAVVLKRIPALGSINFKHQYRITLEEIPPRSEAPSAD